MFKTNCLGPFLSFLTPCLWEKSVPANAAGLWTNHYTPWPSKQHVYREMLSKHARTHTHTDTVISARYIQSCTYNLVPCATSACWKQLGSPNLSVQVLTDLSYDGNNLTLNLLTSTIVAPSSNASKWQMGFNSAFKELSEHLWFCFC